MLIELLQKRIATQQENALYRTRYVVSKKERNHIDVAGMHCINFSSNDYLGLKNHPAITDATIAAIKQYGVGSGGSAFVSGYSAIHKDTEAHIAAWLGAERAILFSSGYCANIGVISALAKRTDRVLSDKLCHTSLLDGITLSRATHRRYRHKDLEHLHTLAQQAAPALIITDSVFSMEGDIAPIKKLTHIAQQYGAGLLIDDAHGIGVLGETGRGVSEYFSLNQDAFSCIVSPLGKAFNAAGAIVSGKKNIIDSIAQFSKSYCYSTALPPAICQAILSALHVMQTETWRLKQLKKNIQFFIDYAETKHLALVSHDETPIKSVLIYDNDKALTLQKYMLSHGFYVSAIRPPSVPQHTSRLRISLNALHTQDQIAQLIDYIITGLATC